MSIVPQATEAERKAIGFVQAELKRRIIQGRTSETAGALDVHDFGVQTLSNRSISFAEAYRIAAALGIQKQFASHL